jgi:hypothetical protein
MAPATPVHRLPLAASSTKAALGFGLQQMLQQCRLAIWVRKPTSAGCLA